jgi:hypothetical protein
MARRDQCRFDERIRTSAVLATAVVIVLSTACHTTQPSVPRPTTGELGATHDGSPRSAIDDRHREWSAASDRRFVGALTAIYQSARNAAASAKRKPLKESVLLDAAAAVCDLAPQYGEFWRFLAIAKLAATDHKRDEFRWAIARMGVPPKEIDKIFVKRRNRFIREFQVYRFVLDYWKLHYPIPATGLGIPSCDWQLVSATHSTVNPDSSVFASTEVWLDLTTTQLAKAADPQNWSHCGGVFFPEVYIALKSNNTFPPADPKDPCVATPDKTRSSVAKWDAYLYEHFLAPAMSGDIHNILHVTHDPGTAGYDLKYEHTQTMCARVGTVTVPPGQGGLDIDDGRLSGTPKNGGVGVTATKTIRFQDLFRPFATPDTLAVAIAPMLDVMGDGLAYLMCCD